MNDFMFLKTNIIIFYQKVMQLSTVSRQEFGIARIRDIPSQIVNTGGGMSHQAV